MIYFEDDKYQFFPTIFKFNYKWMNAVILVYAIFNTVKKWPYVAIFPQSLLTHGVF